MKRMIVVSLLVAAVMCMMTGTGFAAEDVLEEILKAGVVKISTDANYAPQSFLNDNGELDGFDIGVAKEVATRLGVEVEFITPDWDLITSGKWGKRWDLSIGSMTPTVDRKEVLVFTRAYYYTPAQFAIHAKNTTFATLNDLDGKVVGTCSECTYDRYLNRELELLDQEVTYPDWKPGEIRTYKTDADVIQDLALGDGIRLDALLSATATIHEAIQSGCGDGCPLKMLGDPVFYDALSFAIDKSRVSNDSFLAKLDEILDAMHADGTLTELSMTWYGVDLTKKAGE